MIYLLLLSSHKTVYCIHRYQPTHIHTHTHTDTHTQRLTHIFLVCDLYTDLPDALAIQPLCLIGLQIRGVNSWLSKRTKIHSHTKTCIQVFMAGLLIISTKKNDPNVH